MKGNRKSLTRTNDDLTLLIVGMTVNNECLTRASKSLTADLCLKMSDLSIEVHNF